MYVFGLCEGAAQTWGELANSTQKSHRLDSNPGPSCRELTVPIITLNSFIFYPITFFSATQTEIKVATKTPRYPNGSFCSQFAKTLLHRILNAS